MQALCRKHSIGSHACVQSKLLSKQSELRRGKKVTHVQLYLRHLHYNELSKATGQVKKYCRKQQRPKPFKGNLGSESTFDLFMSSFWFPVFVFQSSHLNISFTITHSATGIDEVQHTLSKSALLKSEMQIQLSGLQVQC